MLQVLRPATPDEQPSKRTGGRPSVWPALFEALPEDGTWMLLAGVDNFERLYGSLIKSKYRDLIELGYSGPSRTEPEYVSARRRTEEPPPRSTRTRTKSKG